MESHLRFIARILRVLYLLLERDRTRRCVTLCISIIAAHLIGSPAIAENWPAWRGDGSGVSKETNLPTEWGENKNVLWKTHIDGEGISSPIVWDERVYVTIAVDGTEAVVSRRSVVGLGAGLLLASLLSLYMRRRSSSVADNCRSHRRSFVWASRIDRIGAIVALLLFVTSLGAMLGWEGLLRPGAFARNWRVSGAVAMFGLLAVLTFTSFRSLGRFLVVVIMLTGAVLYHLYAPMGTTVVMPLKELVVVSGPLSVAALWCAFMFFLWPNSVQGKTRPTRQTVWGTVGYVATMALITLQFAYVNYMQPRSGLLRSVVCLDRDSGTTLWQRPCFMASGEKKYPTNSYATPTPATDGEHIVAYYGPGIACMDHEGNIQWRRMEPNYAKFSRYGAASSPVMFENRVFYAFMAEWPGGDGVVFDRSYAKYSHLTALDKTSGDLIWQTTPPGSYDSYDTPRRVRIGDRTVLLLATYERVTATDAQDGADLWSCKVPMSQTIPSIVTDNDRAYVFGGTEGTGRGVAIKLDGRGDITKTHVVWTLKRSIPECPSPVLYEGLLYVVTDGGVGICLEPETGKTVWKERIGGNFDTALVAGDGKVYFTNTDGITTVVRAGRDFKVLAKNSIGENTRASLAISDGKIFIRGDKHLYCIGHE